MTEPTIAPPLSKKKTILLLAGFMAVFYTVAPYLLGGVLSLVYPTDDVELDMALADAKVTDFEMNRQQYNYQLDGNVYKHYYFNAFVAADSAARSGMNDTLGYDPSDLGHYLRRGDRLSKAAGSPHLTVRRGSIVTHWILYSFTPEGKLPPPKETPLFEEDTVAIP
jgi:hypothetical protein